MEVSLRHYRKFLFDIVTNFQEILRKIQRRLISDINRDQLQSYTTEKIREFVFICTPQKVISLSITSLWFSKARLVQSMYFVEVSY